MSEATPPPVGELGGTSGSTDASRGLALFRGASIANGEAYDPAPAWRWPTRIDTIDAMRRNSQVMALETALLMPPRRWTWGINANGARPEVVAFVAENLGLRVLGDDADRPKPRSRGRFSWHAHLRLALRAPSYGAAWFEQVARLDDDGMFRLAKLAPRPLRTITKVNVANDGGLVSIEQGMGAGGTTTIPVERLVAYLNDPDPGSWSGNSLMRALYLHTWMLDKLYRVDAMKHERFGAPMVVFETPPEATDAQREALTLMAQAVRAGESAGGSVPYGTKAHLIGATGTGTDVRKSIDGHLEDMARAWNAQVMMLAQGGTSGNRALGGTFADIMFAAQVGIAEDIRDVANAHVVEDLVDWNWGPDEPCPLIEFDADPSVSTETLLEAVDKGLIKVDTVTENWWRGKEGMPLREPDEVGGTEVFAYDQANGVVTIDEARERKDPPLPPREDGLGKLTVPEFLQAIAGATAADALEGDGVVLEDAVAETAAPIAAHGRFRRALGAARRLVSRRVQAADEVDPMLPDRPVKRQRNAVEVAAAVDFRRLDDAWEGAVDEAVTAWADVQAAQREALIEAITEADGDLIALANLAAPVLGAEVIEAAIRRGVEDGIAAAVDEAAAQGITGGTVPGVDDAIADIPTRAEAMAVTMARSYGEVAGRYAMLGVNTGGDVAATIDTVTTQLDKLTDAFLRDQLGAAVQGGQNAGRFAAFEAKGVDEPPTYHASEIMDGNTCPPCQAIDGEQFASLEEAMEAYPMLGAYHGCDGGPRCRGTVVAQFGEAGATVTEGNDD